MQATHFQLSVPLSSNRALYFQSLQWKKILQLAAVWVKLLSLKPFFLKFWNNIAALNKNRCLFVYAVNYRFTGQENCNWCISTENWTTTKSQSKFFLMGLMVNLWQHINRPFPVSICQYIWGNVSKLEQNKKLCFLNAMWRMWGMYNSPYLSMRHRCLYQSGKHMFNQCWNDPWKKPWLWDSVAELTHSRSHYHI